MKRKAKRSARQLLPISKQLSPTELRNPRSKELDRLPIRRAIQLMLTEEAKVAHELLRHSKELEKAIRIITSSLRSDGRLFYVGAGTSGRLGVLDASECPPTFRTSPEMVQGIIAGGFQALWKSIEGAEDDYASGRREIRARRVNERDVVVGIAASGTTPFIWGALEAARNARAATLLICFNPHLSFPSGTRPDVVLAVNVGPEVLTGSTRLKAGTATKLTLNLLTTLSMVQLGKVMSNLMIDLTPNNTKLKKRAVRIVCELGNVDEASARAALERCRWSVRTAIGELTNLSASVHHRTMVNSRR